MGVSSWEYTINRYGHRAVELLAAEWHLGFTAFGGPPVHFKIWHDKFVTKLKWIDEQLYQELFGIAQALCGPGSTKMLYCINLIHDGFFGAVFGFLIWSLPGALGMFGLAIGVSNIGSALPRAVYALLSGLNAATVGIIALAAVQLSKSTVTDNVTRALVFLSSAAGMLYNALWYFPLLMFLSGVAAVVHDYRWLHKPMKATVALLSWRKRGTTAIEEGKEPMQAIQSSSSAGPSSRAAISSHVQHEDRLSEQRLSGAESEPRVIPQEYRLNFSWKVGTAIIAAFFATFIATMVLRSVLNSPPLLFSLFANLEYVVAEGWVSPRDFLIGLALAQAFPGPNFNFAVFLGTLAASNSGSSSTAGAVIAFVGIFFPGIALVHGTMGVWSSLRNRRWVKSGLRGVNAGAVGLIYTAVYRIWQVGYLDEGFQSGRSLGDDPWWVVVTATAYVGGRYYGVSAPVAIVLGAIMGLIRYGVVSGRG
ncbi:chromate transporter domain-containing protein [Trichoderma breve]|uniref:Chromate transporter domain-containing protein n=1 Tax=Trichoderma breve TaxID=2034170 RepID=A0A9W9BGD8_9HYPO|nr:chromate transporter domain-containing protein [Trichoderma breve]KAJ4860874.1 chromate transporter domain-containing protein [Trichoderma breve]